MRFNQNDTQLHTWWSQGWLFPPLSWLVPSCFAQTMTGVSQSGTSKAQLYIRKEQGLAEASQHHCLVPI